MLGPKQARLGGRHCQAQHGSRLSDMKTPDTTKGIYIPQVFREFAGRIGESTWRLSRRHTRSSGVGVRCARANSAARISFSSGFVRIPPFWPAEIHEALILHDSCDPRAELGVASKTSQVLEGSQIG